MKVLIVVPTHDRTDFLEEALQSISNQTRKADKVVVIGNVVPTYPVDSNVSLIFSQETLATRLNSAIDNTECDAFILLCDDDMLRPEYIERTTRVMESTGADIVYTEFNNEPVTSLVRKSIWKKAGGYCDIGFFDWDFYWSCREAGGVSTPLREHLFIYRQHPAQMETHGRQKADGTWAAWEAAVLEKHPKKGQP